jgi:hypothetical protein
MATTPKQQTRVSKNQLETARKRIKQDPRLLEPKEIDQNDYTSSLAKLLYYYGNNFDNKSKKEWTVNYFKDSNKQLSKLLSKVSHQYFSTVGSLIRMKENGVILKDSIDNRILNLATEISTKADLTIVATPKQDDDQPKAEKIDYFLGEFEGYIDEHLGKKKSLGIVSWSKQFSPTLIQVNALKTLIEKKIAEYEGVGTDKELLDAYRLSKVACRGIVTALREAVSELSTMYQRKPRTPKAVPIQKIVANVKYMKEDLGLGISSIDPAAIIGKTSLVTFNTKTRKIQYYVAEDGKQFGIKGTTLLNYDEAKSMQKTLRNPKDQLLNLLQLPKKQFEKAFSMVKSIETVPSGRLNEDTLICKQFS